MNLELTPGKPVLYSPGSLDFTSARSLMTQHGATALHAVVAHAVGEDNDRATLSVLDHGGVWHVREAVPHESVDADLRDTGYFYALPTKLDELEQRVSSLEQAATTN